MGRAIRRNPGSKKTPNIYDVAREAGVSVFTVSAVVNQTGQVGRNLERRVEAAIQKLNYRPNLLARSLAKRQTHTLGVVVPDIVNPFFPMVVRGAEDVAQKGGYHIVLCNSDNEPAKEELYLELLLSKRVDGILLTKAPGPLSPHLRAMMENLGVPVVLMMRTARNLKADAVLTDDFRGAFEAVNHLARIGYQRIALVGGPLNVSSGRTRWQGYRKALKALHLPFHPSLVVEGDYRVESGYHAGLSLLPQRPDAVYVANYLMTVGFMKAAEEMGLRCPEDFGLVSFDDYPWLACFHPRLTTIDLPKYELGAASAQLLLERIKRKEGRPLVRKLKPQLIVRESCGFRLRKREPVLAESPQPLLVREQP